MCYTVSNKEGRTLFDFPSLVMKLGDFSIQNVVLRTWLLSLSHLVY